MAESVVSQEVQDFLREHIESYEHLEIILGVIDRNRRARVLGTKDGLPG